MSYHAATTNPTPLAPLRGKWFEPETGIALQPWESDLNRAVASLGRHSDPRVRAAVIAAIAPHLGSDRGWVFDASRGADWQIREDNDTGSTLLGQVEHKPKNANIQWSRACVSDLEAPRFGLINTEWLAQLQELRPLIDGGRYTLDEWPHDVWHWGKPHKDGSGEWFFVVPQVLCYAVRAGLPCGIVNDDHASAVDLYLRPGERHALTLPAEMYPITTTANVLDTMAARLDAIRDLDAHTRAEARHVMSGLWMRGPQDIAQLIAPATAEWINADTVHVGENPGLATEAR